MHECRGLGLQINVFQTSSHFYSIFSVCRENYILSYESIYLFRLPGEAATAAFPKQSEEQSWLTRANPASCPERGGALQKAAWPKAQGCRPAIVSKEGKQNLPD